MLALLFAAVHPFHLWYGQEVRMYTVGGALTLAALLCTIHWLQGKPATRRGFILLYILSGASALYVLTYAAFALIAINTIVLVTLVKHQQAVRLRGWIGAQIALLLLFAPWIPIVVRQILEPPVPRWRTPWTEASEFIATVGESLGALVIGQTPPFEYLGLLWPIVALLCCILAFLGVRTESRAIKQVDSILLLLIYIFVPILLIYAITVSITPIYHVRYLFIFAAPFTLVIARALRTATRRNRIAGTLSLLLVLALQMLSLNRFWSNPIYRSDDHRQAVADLAADWRPGDAILVNAGWAYTALEVYWPRKPMPATAARPAPLAEPVRLSAIGTKGSSNDFAAGHHAPLFISGSINGNPNLGWGAAESDFFAMSTAETERALAELAAQYRRVWHYRIYDTVSDPDGLIRGLLKADTDPIVDLPYPGRDFLRVERYDSNTLPIPYPNKDNSEDNVDFGNALHLLSHTTPQKIRAGETLYVNLNWRTLPGLAEPASPLSMSLRLYVDESTLVAQADESPIPGTESRAVNDNFEQVLALPVPSSVAPGVYYLELIVYSQADGIPLAPTAGPDTLFDQRRRLDEISVLQSE